MTQPALTGIRILDLSQVAAGPYATLLLGMMGAEVIKVESCRRPDIARGPAAPRPHQYHFYPGQEPGERPWNRTANFTQRNRNKLGITLDLTVAEGKALFLRLAALCDALVENYRASVIDRWGLNYEVLKEVCPGLVYLKLSSQGNTGPERDYGSLGSTLECTGGLAALTGYLDGTPRMTNEVYPDPVVATLAVGALLAGLRHRRKTGRGIFIDLSQREVTTCLIGSAILDYSMNGRLQGPLGNRHQAFAPQGVYPCRGEDTWIAITVGSDEEWRGLCYALGNPAWTQDSRFADAPSRWHHQDDLDQHLAEWTRQHDHYQAMHILQAQGVPAGAVLKGSELVTDPHLDARGWWDRMAMPEVGREYAYVGAPWALSKSPRLGNRPAPTLGEHNRYVFRDLLGLPEADIAELEAKGILGTIPTMTESPV